MAKKKSNNVEGVSSDTIDSIAQFTTPERIKVPNVPQTTPLPKMPIQQEIAKLRAIGFDDNRIAARLMINVEKIKHYE